MPDAGTIKVPGVGPVKKQYVYAGGFALAAILVFAWWRRSTTVAEDTTTSYAGATTEGDVGDLSGAYDYSSPGTMGYGYDGSTIPSGYQTQNWGDLVDAIKEGLGADTDETGQFTTNSDWADAATGVLTNLGVSQVDAYTAITKVLAGLSVTSQQQQWFLQAKGVLGDPPQGFPTIHLLDTPAQPQEPAPEEPPTTTRKFAGKVTGLKAKQINRTSIVLDWAPATHSEGYGVYVNGVRYYEPRWSSQLITGLRPNTSYKLGVVPRPDAGYTVPAMTNITVKTKK